MMTPKNTFPAGSCPNPECCAHFQHPEYDPDRRPIARKGFYYRSSDHREVQRYRCRLCRRGFSSATRSDCYRQKKRHLNPVIYKLLNSGVSENQTAKLVGTKWETVAARVVILGLRAARWHVREMNRRVAEGGPIEAVQFDEMESFEHSKCKPLSIPLAVEPKSRAILGIRVASMPAKGPLARIAMLKYGPRADHRPQAAAALWKDLRHWLTASPDVLSDQNPRYPNWIFPHFPEATHRTVKGRRGCVVGQGELKRGGFDPLFSLNHTAAMLRANINRLFRRTWCTTKLAWKLELRIWMYVQQHNIAVGWGRP